MASSPATSSPSRRPGCAPSTSSCSSSSAAGGSLSAHQRFTRTRRGSPEQARNLAPDLDGRGSPVRFLIRDRDTKFSWSFDEVVRSEGMRVIRTPVRAPNANAYAERVIETIRAECLDWTLIWGRRHLDRTLRIYLDHYNRQRPHRALGLASPLVAAGEPIAANPCDVRRWDLLGGLIHEYDGAAA